MVRARQGVLIKTLGAESLMNFTSRVLSQLAARRIGSAWRTTGSFCLVSSALHPMCLFPLLIVLCPFAVISHTQP